MKPEPHLPARAEIESQIYVKQNLFSHICGVRARPKQITTVSKHCKNQANVCVLPSITNCKPAKILENNRVVELFDKMPAKQKSYQSAVNNNGLVIFCIVLPSIKRATKASMKGEEIIVKYNQNDKEHISRTLFKHEF